MNQANKRGSLFPQNGPRNLLIVVVAVVTAIVFMAQLTNLQEEIESIDYSTFVERIKSNQVESVQINGQQIAGKLVDKGIFEATIPANDQSIWPLLQDHKVRVRVASEGAGSNFMYLLLLLSALSGVGIVWFFVRRAKNASGNSSGSGIFTMGKSRAKMFMPSSIKENFNSVAGAAEAKEELADVVDFLKNPQKYTRLGAKITRGVLLVGEPGNGKTLLARAVAGEANCPFFTVSGSDFIEVFVGVGASRVRDLFAQARKHAPCIVFIDEIDAVGRHRGSGQGGGNDEREQTLNQLLTEMDGFEVQQDPVIVIAATNRPDVLDKALLRPGRFDRQVKVPYPDQQSREQILAVHIKDVKVDDLVSLHKIARATPGFSGADLANLINEAAIIASKKNADHVTMHDFEEARDKILLGKEIKTFKQTEQDRKITAYHEAGHALVPLMLPDLCDPLHKITILPRGNALGVTFSLPEREKYHRTKAELEAEIMKALGGRVAEEVIFGNVTTGASNDFVHVSQLARAMVCDWGMDEEVGPIVFDPSYNQFPYSQSSAQAIDKAVRRIVDTCYGRTKELIVQNRDKLEVIAQALLERETLQAADVYELLQIQPREDLRLV